jgi:hypothetical protein
MANDTQSIPVPQPLAGQTTTDDKMVFEPERLSYRSARRLATDIANELRGRSKADPIIIASLSELADIANLRGTNVMIDMLRKDYEQAAKSAGTAVERRTALLSTEGGIATLIEALPALTPLSGIATAVNAGLGLASLFRQDVSFSGSAVSVDAIAFEIALAAALKKLEFEHVLLPALGVFPSNPQSPSLAERLQSVDQAKLEVWKVVRPLISELVALDTQLDLQSRAKNQSEIDRLTGEINSLRADLSPISEPLAALDQRWSQLQGEWQKVASDTGLTGFARLLRAEAIQREGTLYLHAAVVSNGGHRRITRSLLRTMFTGDNLTFTGGVVVRWALLDSSGEVQQGGLLTRHKTLSASPGLVKRVKKWFTPIKPHR